MTEAANMSNLFIGKGAYDPEPWTEKAFVGRPKINMTKEEIDTLRVGVNFAYITWQQLNRDAALAYAELEELKDRLQDAEYDFMRQQYESSIDG
jgi:hypothetical protein